ncbi:glycosyltransferase family 2 protein [Rhodococcus sp. PML026]|uniref:glycosyltransferase family 2 protein n=1 Tax=Rhodococcus sp. PML026 TaxID=1356405 RepID=UPI0009E62EAB
MRAVTCRPKRSHVMKIAIAMACRNRAAQSEAIARSLLEQQDDSTSIKIFAVDDGSSDDTSHRLGQAGATVIRGNGELYWAGGMRVAHNRAMRESPDIIVWVNDDVKLNSDAISTLVQGIGECAGSGTILVGAVVGPEGEITYGGRLQARSNPLSFRLASSDLLGRAVDTFNANFVAIPRPVFQQIEFPSKYRHGYADLVYGLLARRAGFNVRMLSRPIGQDSRNPATGSMFNRSVPLRARINFALSPFGIPLRDHWRFSRVCANYAAPVWFVYSYVRVLLPKSNNET